jgi:ABC-type multidrug transport system permease subunit
VQRLPVFTKQRDNLFYPGWAFALPTTFLELPYAVIETVVWSGIIYYIVGLAPEAAHFFCFILILIMLQSMCTALFRLVGALGRSLVSANTGGTFMFLILLVCGGFILAKRELRNSTGWVDAGSAFESVRYGP